jgi:hypothetical protein
VEFLPFDSCFALACLPPAGHSEEQIKRQKSKTKNERWTKAHRY